MSYANCEASGVYRPLATLRAVLAEIGWSGGSDESDGNIFVDLNTQDVPVAYAHAAISDDLEQFVLHLVLAVVVATDRRDECALFITRINHGILVGGFDLDFDTGQVCFRSGVSFRGSALRAQQIRNAILGALQAVEMHAGAIAATVTSGSPAVAAEHRLS